VIGILEQASKAAIWLSHLGRDPGYPGRSGMALFSPSVALSVLAS
jgi:hypothetical protein